MALARMFKVFLASKSLIRMAAIPQMTNNERFRHGVLLWLHILLWALSSGRSKVHRLPASSRLTDPTVHFCALPDPSNMLRKRMANFAVMLAL